MWRTRAVRSFLLEDIAHLHSREGETPGDEELERAQSRSLVIAVIDWVALAVLFAARRSGAPFLALGPLEETAFTAGVLIVAVHSGFRLGQWEKLRAVRRLIADLDERNPER